MKRRVFGRALAAVLLVLPVSAASGAVASADSAPSPLAPQAYSGPSYLPMGPPEWVCERFPWFC